MQVAGLVALAHHTVADERLDQRLVTRNTEVGVETVKRALETVTFRYLEF
jgi:hypothetical protein